MVSLRWSPESSHPRAGSRLLQTLNHSFYRHENWDLGRLLLITNHPLYIINNRLTREVGMWAGRWKKQEYGMEGVWGGSQVWSRPAAPQKQLFTCSSTALPGCWRGSFYSQTPRIPLSSSASHLLLQRSDPASHIPGISIFPLSFTMLLLSLLTTSLNISAMGASLGTSMVAQMVKNLPAMQETRVQSLGQEDPLEKGMETHSSILPWRIFSEFHE